jgi:hypothetical protein
VIKNFRVDAPGIAKHDSCLQFFARGFFAVFRIIPGSVEYFATGCRVIVDA